MKWDEPACNMQLMVGKRGPCIAYNAPRVNDLSKAL